MNRFLVSAGRSGSTFIAKCLNMHPDIVCLLESHYIPLLDSEYGTEQVRPEDILHTLEKAKFVNNIPIIIDNLEKFDIELKLYHEWKAHLCKKYHTINTYQLQDEIENFFKKYTGKKIFIDKTPCYGCHLDVLTRHFPESKYVNIVRDALPSIYSMSKHPGFISKVRNNVMTWTEILQNHDPLPPADIGPINTEEITKIADLWAYRTITPIDYAKDKFKLPLLKYEDLEYSPEKIFKSLADYFEFRTTAEWIQGCLNSIQISNRPLKFNPPVDTGLLLQRETVISTRKKIGYAGVCP